MRIKASTCVRISDEKNEPIMVTQNSYEKNCFRGEFKCLLNNNSAKKHTLNNPNPNHACIQSHVVPDNKVQPQSVRMLKVGY